jgi:hypothetical protein
MIDMFLHPSKSLVITLIDVNHNGLLAQQTLGVLYTNSIVPSYYPSLHPPSKVRCAHDWKSFLRQIKIPTSNPIENMLSITVVKIIASRNLSYLTIKSLYPYLYI